MPSVNISKQQYLDCINLNDGLFYPVKKFMNKNEIELVANKMMLPNKKVFPLPVFLDFSNNSRKILERKGKVDLILNKKEVGYFIPSDIFVCDKNLLAKKIFGYSSIKHPGVKKFYNTGDFFATGTIKILKKKEINFFNLNFSIQKVKNFFKKKKWKSIVGFQTRNIPHLGHEYIFQKMLEKYDGLFINPLVGEKKGGDFTVNAIMKSYKTLLKKFYPKNKIFFSFLTTNMRYAGPREAIFHAIIRKNFGCNRFVIGRDHAGVGNFYGDYDAHKLAKKFEKKINIKIIKFKGPFFCKKCNIVTNEDFCKHYRDKESIIDISGTEIRKELKKRKFNNCKLVRKEVLQSLKREKLFL